MQLKYLRLNEQLQDVCLFVFLLFCFVLEKETIRCLRVYSPPWHVAKLDGDPEDSRGVGADGRLKGGNTAELLS